jgi:mono/diheme cytochrome c family protein
MVKSQLVAVLAWTALALLFAGLVMFLIAPRIESLKAPEARQATATTTAASTPHPAWAVRASKPGSDRPPAGRSLFDFVATREQDGTRVYDIPFPFEALLHRVNARAGCGTGSDCLRVVLIPLGRSLQRLAATPDFFAHPRIVAAVTDEGDDATALLKDRLYIGYQEQAALLEVISYNEAAGRFEFQLVHDYRAGATPRVRYARRQVCAACHQNLSPIFSRPLWAETNANPRVADELARHRDSFEGVPVRRGVDIPNAIDTATDHANMLGVWQTLWHDGCGKDSAAGRRCRGAAVLAALQYRLGGERGVDTGAAGWREDFQPAFARQWRARWPAGLAIPNPDLPSHDPLHFDTPARPAGAMLAHVPARFEPLLPRPPLDVWRVDAGETADAATQLDAISRRYVAGLGDAFTTTELRALDRQLRERADDASDSRQQYAAQCSLERDADTLRFECKAAPENGGARLAGRLELGGNRVAGGVVDGLAIDGGAPLSRLAVTPGIALDAHGVELRLRDRDRRVRLADGRAVDRVELRWHDAGAATATATIGVIDDLAPLRDAIAAIAADDEDASPLSRRTFNRARLTSALFARLGMEGRTDCCDDASRLPVAEVEPAAPAAPTQGPAEPFAGFFPQCGGCHATGETSPPNFLAGTGAQVAAKLRHCAPRIYVRLSMWHRDPRHREKTPMPPPFPSTSGKVATAPDQVAALEQVAAGLLRRQTGRAPRLDALLAEGYEALPSCLPPVHG